MDIDKLNDIETSIAEVRSLFDHDVQVAVQKFLEYFEFTYVSVPFSYELVTAHELYDDGILRATLMFSIPKESMSKEELKKFVCDVHYTLAGNEVYYEPRYIEVDSTDNRFIDQDTSIFAFDFKWHSKSYEFLLNERRTIYESD